MDALLPALADPARWRLVTLLAQRPRPVGILAQLAGARQPQTTKHLQTLERAGLVSSHRAGQRRIYSLRSAPLRDLAAALTALADTTDRPGGATEAFERHGLNVQAERLVAKDDGWADGRTFEFSRSLAAPPELVWRHLTEPDLVAGWWTPDDLRVSGLVFEAERGGRIVLEYRDREDVDGSDVVVGRAEGQVEEVQPGQRLTYWSSPELPDGSPAFTAHVEIDLRPTDVGTSLELLQRITGSTTDAAEFIAGIELGVGQSLDRLAANLAADLDNDTDNDTTHTRSTT